MKHLRLQYRYLLYVCLFFRLALSGMHAEEMAIVPLRPSELLKLLPSVDGDWRMTASVAQDIPDAWPRSKASREYLFNNPDDAEAPAVKLRLTILDTGGHPGTLHRFASPGPGESSAASDRIQIAGMPAIRKAPDGGRKTHVEALVLKRFLLIADLEAPPQPPGATGARDFGTIKPEKWLEKFNLAALRDAAKSPTLKDVSKDHVMIVERIDEMHPARSSRSTWSFAVELPKKD